jgi:hypothetical protein
MRDLAEPIEMAWLFRFIPNERHSRIMAVRLVSTVQVVPKANGTSEIPYIRTYIRQFLRSKSITNCFRGTWSINHVLKA